MDRYKRTEDIVIPAYAGISLMQHDALNTNVVQPQRLSFLRMQESLISPRPGGIINPVISAYAGISLMPVGRPRVRVRTLVRGRFLQEFTPYLIRGRNDSDTQE